MPTPGKMKGGKKLPKTGGNEGSTTKNRESDGSNMKHGPKLKNIEGQNWSIRLGCQVSPELTVGSMEITRSPKVHKKKTGKCGVLRWWCVIYVFCF